MRGRAATLATSVMLVSGLGACGSAEDASEDLIPLTASTTAAATMTTSSTVAPSSSVAASTSPTTTTTTTTTRIAHTVAPSTSASPVTITNPAATIVLRGDGLGAFPFGTPQQDVMAAFTDLMGQPGMDAGPPDKMVTPGLNGCAVMSEFAAMFEGGIVVGFSDQGEGPVLTSWSAFVNGNPPAPMVIPMVTEEALPVGASIDEADRIYGEHFHPRPESGWLWPYMNPIAAIDSEGGTIAFVDLFDVGRLSLFTAGVGCQPFGLLAEPLGPDPLGLRYVADATVPSGSAGYAMLRDPTTGAPTGWSSYGAACADDSCVASIDAVGEPNSTAASALWAARQVDRKADKAVWTVTDVRPFPTGLQQWGAWDCTNAVPFSDDSGAIALLLSVDVTTGKFVEVTPAAAQCVEIMGD
jgi:hypothetical protein